MTCLSSVFCSTDSLAADATQRLGWRFAKRFLVRGGKASQFEEAAVGRDAGYRDRRVARGPEGTPCGLESLRAQAALGAHAAHAVEGVPEPAFAEAHHARQPRNGYLSSHLCACKGFGALDDFLLGCRQCACGFRTRRGSVPVARPRTTCVRLRAFEP